MASIILEKIGNFLFPKTPDEQFRRDLALGHEVLVVGGDGGPLIDGYPELTNEERAKLPGYALAAHKARVEFDLRRGETDEDY